MPPKVRITRQMVADAAFKVVRAEGAESLNVRRVAKELNCSTQPVLYSFATVEELRKEVYKTADAFHTAYIMPDESAENPLLSLGQNYIRFGREEKHLFRFLFQTDSLGSDFREVFASPELDGMIGIVAAATQCDIEEARRRFMAFFAAAHGFASLLANNAMEYDDELIDAALNEVFNVFG